MFDYRRYSLVLLIVVAFVAVGCTTPLPQPTLSPLISVLPDLPLTASSDSPSIESRPESAFQAYPVALKRAQEWNPNARLHAIMPTLQMARNLGLPSVADGWFFMFKEVGSPVEFYVQVAGGEIIGYTEAQAILGETLPYQYAEIDVDRVLIDDRQLLQIFRQRGGEPSGNGLLDYRLVRLSGQQNPVWTLFSANGSDFLPLLHVDAVTGKETADPFE